MAPRAQGAKPRTEHLFRYLPSVCGTQLCIAVLVYWWDIDVLGLLCLTQPAVTSASGVLTQTYRSSGVVQWLACWAHNPRSKRAKLHEHVQNRTPDKVQEQDWRQALLLCLFSSSSQVAHPPAHATAPLMVGSSKSRRPPSSRSTQACDNTPHRLSLVCLVSCARQ